MVAHSIGIRLLYPGTIIQHFIGTVRMKVNKNIPGFLGGLMIYRYYMLLVVISLIYHLIFL